MATISVPNEGEAAFLSSLLANNDTKLHLIGTTITPSDTTVYADMMAVELDVDDYAEVILDQANWDVTDGLAEYDTEITFTIGEPCSVYGHYVTLNDTTLLWYQMEDSPIVFSGTGTVLITPAITAS